MQIGLRLATTRKQLQLTQQQVADQLHVTRQTVSNWENERSYPDIASLIDLSNLYHVSLDNLLKEDAMMMAKVKADAAALKKARHNYLLSWFVDLVLVSVLILSQLKGPNFELGRFATMAVCVLIVLNVMMLIPFDNEYRRLADKQETGVRELITRTVMTVVSGLTATGLVLVLIDVRSSWAMVTGIIVGVVVMVLVYSLKSVIATKIIRK